MARCIFIIQGEGRGHLSQSIAMKEILEKAGHLVETVFVGINPRTTLPDYFLDSFGDKLNRFQSPFFLRTPNRKGIYIGKTLLYNLFRSYIYLKEVARIRREITISEPDVVYNFYDVVGALALERIDPDIKRIGVGHHFFLHMDGYRCEGGATWHRWLLALHTRRIIRSCDRILALSFRSVEDNADISVIPPLIRRRFREGSWKPGKRYLAYFLHEGFIFDLIAIARTNPEFEVDVFTSITPGIELPPGINLYPLDEEEFRKKMHTCRGLITTSGFDTVAEAAYQGIPIFAVPVKHHFEQRCNSHDLERAGIGLISHRIEGEKLSQLKAFNNKEYRVWVESAGNRVIKILSE